MRLKLLDDAVADGFIVTLGLEGAKHLVPDNETTGVIAVKVTGVGCVVDAVVAAVEICLILPFADCDLGALLKSRRPIVHSNYELPTLIQ